MEAVHSQPNLIEPDEIMMVGCSSTECVEDVSKKDSSHYLANHSCEANSEPLVLPKDMTAKPNIVEEEEEEEEEENHDNDDSSSECSYSSYGSSCCSSVVIPVVRPVARRAASPSPEVAFAHSGPPVQGSPARRFNSIGSEPTGVFSPVMFCLRQSPHAEKEMNVLYPKDRLRNMNSMMNTSNPSSPVKRDVSYNNETNICGLTDCCGSLCAEGISETRSFSLCDSMENSSGSTMFMSSTSHCKNTRMINENNFPSRRDRASLNRPVWWVRRHARMENSGRRRKRRTSPVFDNMPVVPESPTVSTTSSEESHSDESPIPLSPPVTGISETSSFMKETHAAGSMKNAIKSNHKADFNSSFSGGWSISESANAVGASYSSEVIKCSNSTHNNSSSRSRTISAFKTEHASSCQPNDQKVPMIVTCTDLEDDNYSTSSWASHSALKSDYSLSSYHHRGSTSGHGSTAKSVSSESLSLPVMIGPAYKFTPIERDFSYDCSEAGSYEVQGVDYDDMTDYDGHDSGVDGDGDTDIEEIYPRRFSKESSGDENGDNEVWCVFDMPLLLSKTIFDWAGCNKE